VATLELDGRAGDRTRCRTCEFHGGSASGRADTFSCVSACLAAAFVLGASAWTSPCRAIPPGGPPPPPDCIGDITGRLTANPAAFDRDEDTSFDTILTWSVDVPKGCPVSPTLTLVSPTLPLAKQEPRSGSDKFTVVPSLGLPRPRPTTFSLVLTSRNEQRTLATVRVAVAGDPGFITVSAGPRVTPDDITKFNEQWMQPFELLNARNDARRDLKARDPDGVWTHSERMAAMVRMFELTHDTRYLDHLRDLIQIVLQFRDDLPFDSLNVIRPLEQIRNERGVPAWGGDGGRPDVEGVEYGGLHHVEEIVSSLYAYPIAAFAHIVAEDPALQTKYGDDAVEDANLVFDTVAFFMRQIEAVPGGGFVQARLIGSDGFRNRPTAGDCDSALNQAMMDHPDDAARWTQQHSDCLLKREGAGRDLPHNINLTFSMALIELARAIGTNFYQQSPKRSVVAAARQDELLLAAVRQQRYFANHLWSSGVIGPCFMIDCWSYAEDAPPDHKSHIEDLDHGAMDMNYLDVSLQNYILLNNAAQRFKEPLALGSKDWQALARTFLVNTEGTNFKHDIAGKDEPPPYVANSRCEGWVTLSRQSASTIYQRCHDVSLRIVDGTQPYLNIGNHSSLLANKQFGPPQQ
jgi:hypothetical protein